MGADAMILVFWVLNFNPNFSLSYFTLIKRLFSSSSLSAIRVVSSVYLRLLIFLPSILIPACALPSPAFLTMYSAYKLNKQGDSIQLWCTPFLVWNQSVVPCRVLTVASWPAYRFLRYIHTMEYSSAIKNEILVHAYNMDELWIAKWKKPVTKYHIIWFHLYAVSRTD